MTRRTIEYLLAVHQLKSFSKAADACFISQSTLSAMVSKFEEVTGVVMFDRKTKPITTTKQGTQIVKHLESINREYILLDDKISLLKGYETGNVSIACIPTIAPYLLPLILKTITSIHKKVNFKIFEQTTENMVSEIMTGNIDIGIVSLPLFNEELLEHPLYNEEFFLYDCNIKKKKTIYKVTDIDFERLWLLEEGHCLRNQVEKVCKLRQTRNLKQNVTYNSGSIFTLIELVKKNGGVTLLPSLAAVNNPSISNKHVFKLAKPIPTRQIGLITHKNFVKKRILESFIRCIKNEISKVLDEKKPNSLTVVNPF